MNEERILEWAEYELKYPCPPSERAKWPMASPTCGKMTYSTSVAAADHKTMCVAALGEEVGRKKTPHAHRVGTHPYGTRGSVT